MFDVAPPPDAPEIPVGFLAAVGLDQDREADVARFRDMLRAANARTNLVGASTMEDFDRRHFLDSAQLVWLEPSAIQWVDLGSGAGLPGIILAILMKGRPGARVHLVESMGKRCKFLAEVISALDLPAILHHARAEDLDLKAEVVTARACAPLTRLLGYARPYLDRGARGLFLKGREVEAEVAEASRTWRFTWRSHSSLSDLRGRILAVEGLQHV